MLQTGGVPNPHDPTSEGGKGYNKTGIFVWFLWMLFLAGSIVSTFASLLTTFLSYGSLEVQYRDCMVEMDSGVAFLNAVAPLFPFLPPIVAKISGLAANVFVLLQGVGVFKSLGPETVEKVHHRLMAPLVGPLGFISVGYFFFTLC